MANLDNVPLEELCDRMIYLLDDYRALIDELDFSNTEKATEVLNKISQTRYEIDIILEEINERDKIE